MNPHIPIPEGWERVPVEGRLQQGDKYTWDERNTDQLNRWMTVPSWEYGQVVGPKRAPIIRQVKQEQKQTPVDPKLAIPEGWERVPIGGTIQAGDKYTWNRLGTENLSAWIAIGSSSTGRVIDSNIAPIIREVKQCGNVVAPAVVNQKNEEEEKKNPMSNFNKANLIALLALVQRDASDDVLPGADGEGVFAAAIKQAEVERREAALKSLTSMAREIQDRLATTKQRHRSDIRSLQQQIDTSKAALNTLDQAASALAGNEPNPFPLLRALGLVNNYDLGISHQEFEKLCKVATPNEG